MRLLVGLDRREGGRDALELARVLGSTEASSALVVTVLYTGPYPMEFALVPEEEAEEAGPLFDEARAKLEGLEVETHAFGGGSPAAILHNLLTREHFDAVVVGSPHRGAVGRVLIGSVAAGLLSGSPTAVAVAPRRYSDGKHTTLQRIAVAYDGSDESAAALRRGEAIAMATDAAIELLTVVSPPRAVPAMVPVYTPTLPLDPERVIKDGVSSVGSGVTIEGVRLDGDPVEQLIRRCEVGIDLLIVGSRGYGPGRGVFLGSVSRPVAEHAPCPVLVVPQP